MMYRPDLCNVNVIFNLLGFISHIHSRKCLRPSPLIIEWVRVELFLGGWRWTETYILRLFGKTIVDPLNGFCGMSAYRFRPVVRSPG